ncbi:MAG: sigma-70 family RNA polymerase sigma factor [Clostridiales bacterium]|nr:sigma-70 family RNA polymerase sigma factor [Clostridiales bacterium]
MSTLRGEVNKLLAGIKAGKEHYKKKLFERTYNHLKIIARCYVQDKNDVEDVLQMTYLRAFKYIEALDSSKDGYNWLCKIVQNEAYTLAKKNPVHFSLDDYSQEANSQDVWNNISDKDELYRYLEGYSALDRQLLYLKFYENYSYFEIAEKMGMKKSNVHRRIAKMLKEILKKQKSMDEND